MELNQVCHAHVCKPYTGEKKSSFETDRVEPDREIG